jgi:hypothetical protein
VFNGEHGPTVKFKATPRESGAQILIGFTSLPVRDHLHSPKESTASHMIGHLATLALFRRATYIGRE